MSTVELGFTAVCEPFSMWQPRQVSSLGRRRPAFIASAASGFLTRQVMNVDGGWAMV